MTRGVWLAASLMLITHTALAGTASGGGALALAALIGEHSPQLDRAAKDVLKALLNGNTAAPYPSGQKIEVASAVTCRAGNVDITQHSCDLVFGPKQVTIRGRAAHELYATLIEVKVPVEGAAGSLYAAVTNLSCTVDPSEVKQNAGGGAQCNFKTN